MLSNLIKNGRIDPNTIQIKLLKSFQSLVGSATSTRSIANKQKPSSEASNNLPLGDMIQKLNEMQKRLLATGQEVKQLEAKREKLDEQIKRETQKLMDLKKEQKALEKELENLKDKAREEGLAEGRKQGRKDAEQEVLKLWESEKHKLEERCAFIQQEMKREQKKLQDRFEETLASQRTQLKKIILEIAERIIKDHLAKEPASLEPMLNEALARVAEAEKVKIKVAPEWVAFFEQKKKELAAHLMSTKELLVVGDKKVEKGDLMVQSTQGNIDARLATQMKEVERALS